MHCQQIEALDGHTVYILVARREGLYEQRFEDGQLVRNVLIPADCARTYFEAGYAMAARYPVQPRTWWGKVQALWRQTPAPGGTSYGH